MINHGKKIITRKSTTNRIDDIRTLRKKNHDHKEHQEDKCVKEDDFDHEKH
jgi:hypothetical protein